MKYRLKYRLALAIAAVVLFCVATISLLSITTIRSQFKNYVAMQQEERTRGLVTSLGIQYQANGMAWEEGFVHAIGMAALDDGYIIRVEDPTGGIVWDAQSHDTTLCNDIMRDISQRMGKEFPNIEGTFEQHEIELTSDAGIIGKLVVGYYEPFFMDENDFDFIRTLSALIAGVGFLALAIASIAGIILAAGISRPLQIAAEAAREIASGNYKVKLDESTDTAEIHTLVESINQLAGSLEKQDDIRKRLVEDVSHEIRTPVAILQTHLESMLEGLRQPTAENLQSCYEEALRVGKLMKDIEGLKKVNFDEILLQKTRFMLKKVIRRATEGFALEIESKGLQVAIEGEDCEIFADEDRIEQVMVNLLSNAIKYSDFEGSINIKVADLLESVQISVTDTGIGIPEQERPFIFERFYRADKSRNRKTGGSGLGLAIVKAIIEAHGGTVSVEGDQKKGTRFVVLLPNL